jgi:5-methylcytosine-specific restriction protein A
MQELRKVCHKCGADETAVKFSKKARGSICLPCRRQYCREYHARNRTDVLARKRVYDALPENRLRKKAPSAKSKELQRRRKKEKWATDVAFRASQLEKNKQWREQNSDHRAAYKKAYRKANRDKSLMYCARRRALKSATPARNDLTGIYKLCVSSCRLRCYWCKGWAKKGERQVDHIVPLSKGGQHALENLCIACRVCNQQKSDRLPEEYSRQFELFGRAS